jgi:hypothetical protein
MWRTTLSSGNCSGLILAVILILTGIAVFVLIPCFGWIIGPLVCLLALFMGGKRRKVWKCGSCGSIFDRA